MTAFGANTPFVAAGPPSSEAPATDAVALSLPRPFVDEIVRHVRAALPHEAVGLLAVPAEPADRANGERPAPRAVRFYPGTNIDASPTRYTMDPRQVIQAFEDMSRRGWRLGAIVHSHPATPPVPSPTDLREAHYPDAVMLIVSLQTGEPVFRAWRYRPDLDEAASLSEVRVALASAGVGENRS